MSYPEFREVIFDMLKGMVPANVELQLLQVEKLNNCVRFGISFTKDRENYAPTIYLEPFYRSFRDGTAIEELAKEVLRCYEEETIQIPDCIYKMEQFQSAKPLIFAKMIHVEENRKLLMDTPHAVFLDFAIVPYFEVDNQQIYRGSVLIKQHHLELWNISEKELLDWAIQNTKAVKGVWFRSMSEVLADFLSEEDGEMLERAKSGMYVLTNMDKYLGAVLIYFPDVLERIGQRLEESFYLLPASVHEWVIVPKSQVCKEEALFTMVRDINDSEVAKEEILSYNVYFYSTNSQKINVLEEIKLKNY